MSVVVLFVLEHYRSVQLASPWRRLSAPLFGGLAVAGVGSTAALAMVCVPDVGAVLALDGVADAASGTKGGRSSLLRSTWEGVRVVFRDATLRGLAVISSVTNIGPGILVIALPVVVIDRPGDGSATVNLTWGLEGGAAVVAGILVGRLDTAGRERGTLAAAEAMMAGGLVVVAIAPSLPVLIAGMLLFGAGDGPRCVCLASPWQPGHLRHLVEGSHQTRRRGMPSAWSIGGVP